MYKSLALVNGAILAIMIFVNGMLAGIIGPYAGTFIFHFIGLLLIIVLSVGTRNTLFDFRRLKLHYLFPGVFSVLSILLTNLCIPQIGIMLTTSVSLFGQLVMSSFIEHFGLLGMPKNRFKPKKLYAYAFILAGTLSMIWRPMP